MPAEAGESSISVAPASSAETPSLPPEGALSAPPRDASAPPPSGPRRVPLYLVITLAVVIVVVVAGTVAFEMTHRTGGGSSPPPIVLVVKDSLYILPAGQFAASEFTISRNATVNGTIDQTGGINLYTMTPAQVFGLSKSGSLSGYEWTTSLVRNGTVYNIDLTFGPGAWDVVFLDPSTNPSNSSSVGFLSGLYLEYT